MKLDVSNSITWLGEGWHENAGEKSKMQPLLSCVMISPSHAGLLAGISQFVFCLVVMWIVVCLIAPVMLTNS